MGVDHRFFESRHLTKFRTADKLAIHPLAIGNYNESHRILEFRNDTDADTVTHELAHHIDIAFTRQPNREPGDRFSINRLAATKVVADYTEEYQAARSRLSEQIGHKFNFTNDYKKLESSSKMVRGLPTLYAADSAKEWWAESVMLYAKGGAAKERLGNVAPKTYRAIETVLKGKIFKS
jgi:hypothetical protein